MGPNMITDIISVFFICAYTYNSQLVNLLFIQFDFVKSIYLLIHLCIYSFIDLINHLCIYLSIYLII